jgi:hypothetical protein
MWSLALGIGGSPLLGNDLIRRFPLEKGRLFPMIYQIENSLFNCCASILRHFIFADVETSNSNAQAIKTAVFIAFVAPPVAQLRRRP